MKIQYIGELFENSGYGIAARINIALLHKMGHTIYPVPLGAKQSADSDWKMKILTKCMDNQLGPNEKPDLVFCHLYPPQALAQWKIPGVPLLCYIAWEVDMLSTVWAHHINKNADIVVTTCEEMKRVFKRSGVKPPVKVLGPTIFEEDLQLIDTTKPIESEIPPGMQAFYSPNKYIFYSVFQWIERKNPERLIEAFLEEFDSNEDDVALLLKTYRLGYSQQEFRQIQNAIQIIHRELNLVEHPEIRIIMQQLTDADMRMLHKMGNCYVSPHRGEGTGLGIIDAILYENPCIITPYGGPQDFTRKEEVMHLNYEMTPIRNKFWCMNYFNCHMKWADVDIMHLRKAMRRAYSLRKDNIHEYGCTGADPKGAKEYLLDVYSIDSNMSQMKHILKDI